MIQDSSEQQKTTPATSRYATGRIYKLVSARTDKVYIGSTIKTKLSSRMAGHRSQYHRWQKGIAGYLASFELLQYDDVRIVLIEEWPCETKDQLLAREQYWIDHYAEVRLNKHAAYSGCNTLKEYNRKRYLANAEQIRDRTRQYYALNRDQISERAKVYRENNRDKILAQKKEYYYANRDKIVENQQHYYAANCEYIRTYRTEKFNCDCGGRYSYSNKQVHLRSHKHQKWLASQLAIEPTTETVTSTD